MCVCVEVSEGGKIKVREKGKEMERERESFEQKCLFNSFDG